MALPSLAGLLTSQTDSEMAGDEDDEDDDTLVTTSVTIHGSVHASGEAYLNIKTLYSDDERVPIRVRGSVHKTGYEETNVDERRPLPENARLDPAESGKGFSNHVRDWPYENSVVENGVVNIDDLVIITDPTPELIIAAADRYGTYYDEIDFDGNVHSPGTITVNVENLYVIES